MRRKLVLIGALCALLIALLLIEVPKRSRRNLQNIYYYYRSHYSQFSEEFAIRSFFKDKTNGFFVDAGASHYSCNSTTYFLEKELGWRGIAIDPIDRYAGEYKHFRPNTQFFSYVLSDKSGEMTDFYRSNTPEISTVRRDRSSQDMVMERIETATLNDLLARNGVEKIDFLSMDIEGYEPVALAGFDIVRYSPALVCIEASPENHEKLLSYFQKNGYVKIEDLSVLDDGLNWYFAPSGSP